jgi:NTP pyrophosphatase (non-canonical NTP hydrolase)
MADERITIGELKSTLAQFNAERGWEKYHNLKDLAIAITVEVGGLLELFMWSNNEEIKLNERIKEEFADVFIYLIDFAIASKIDISEAIEEKLKKNEVKYPKIRR